MKPFQHILSNLLRQGLILCLLPILWAPALKAQADSNAKLLEVRLEGLALIETSMVFSQIQSKAGQPLSPALVSQDLVKLYKTGYFDDINAEILQEGKDNYILVYHFVEKPRIRNVNIVGATILSKSDWEDELKATSNNMVNIPTLKRDLETLRQKYREKGYLTTRLDYRILPVEKASGLVDVEYQITEQPQIFLTEIHVSGTEKLFPLDVERLMQSSEIDCFSWFTKSGVFLEDKVNQDLQIITQHYMQQGYVTLRIDKPKVIITDDNGIVKAKIFLHITEGPQYFTGKVDIVTDDGKELLINKDVYIEKFELKEGRFYNPFLQNSDLFKIQDAYMERGYAFSQVQPQTMVDEEKRLVHITYHILQRDKAYIGRVEINGNFETQDHVIRRELRIHDNELFNGVKLRESRTNINRLGFFEANTGIEVNKSIGRNETEINYDFNLMETRTGTFQASIAYGGFTGMALNMSLSKKNVMGSGRSLSFSVENTESGNYVYDLSMTNPYFLGSDITNTFSIFDQFDPNSEQYKTRSKGFRVGFSKTLWEDIYGQVNYSYKNEYYTDQTDVGFEILQGANHHEYRSLRTGTGISTVNNPMFPSEGFSLSIDSERFGGPFGGSIDFIKNNLGYKHFVSLSEDKRVIFMLKLTAGQLIQTDPNREIPVHQRFMLGGAYTVRGHDYNAIRGPSGLYETPAFDIRTTFPYTGDTDLCPANPSCTATKNADRLYFEQHAGGIDQRLGTMELLFPLTREGQNIRGVVFYDMGNVWAEDRMYQISGRVKDYNYYRKSAGTGVRFITPMGVLRFEYALKLDKKPLETPSKFEFTISSLF